MSSPDNFSFRYDFGILASQYDGWYQTREGRTFDLLEKQAFHAFIGSVRSRGNLLDVGCGTGWWSYFFSHLGFSITGVDISPEMVAAARAKNIPSATFQVADAHKLPFADNSFTASAAIASLEFVKKPQTVVKEMACCTRSPGGTIYLGFLNASSKINQKRMAKKGSPYEKARFFTIKEIIKTFSPIGKVQTAVCAFPLAVMLGKSGLWIDWIGTRLKFNHGAFIAVRIDL